MCIHACPSDNTGVPADDASPARVCVACTKAPGEYTHTNPRHCIAQSTGMVQLSQVLSHGVALGVLLYLSFAPQPFPADLAPDELVYASARWASS